MELVLRIWHFQMVLEICHKSPYDSSYAHFAMMFDFPYIHNWRWHWYPFIWRSHNGRWAMTIMNKTVKEWNNENKGD